MKQCSQLNYASKIPCCNIKPREIGLYNITTGRILYPASWFSCGGNNWRFLINQVLHYTEGLKELGGIK